jgi:subtilisin family serine protease
VDGYLARIALQEGDTRASVEATYHAAVEVWQWGDTPADRYALLRVNDPAAVPDTLQVVPNQRLFIPGGQMAQMNGGAQVWAGGGAQVWAGGGANVWAGGGANLWAGGSFAWMPQNNSPWKLIHLDKVPALAPRLGYGVKVAVIDTGVDLDHPALREALAPADERWDFVDDDPVPQEEGTLGEAGYGHGTNVAGIVRQVAPRATILPLRVLGSDGRGNILNVVKAIRWAADKGAQVINLSLGADEPVSEVEEAVRYAVGKGALVTASVGNSGNTNVTYPAYDFCEECLEPSFRSLQLQRISVGSVNLKNQPSTFSSRNEKGGKHHVEIAAPGEMIYGPAPGERMAAWSGTSMAAPVAAGLLALAIGEKDRFESWVDTKTLTFYLELKATSLPKEYADLLGAGRLDAEDFLKAVLKDK